ncbi:MAG: Lipoprotein-releasing system ATP-binding protein LolD [Bacteroidia bacterium]|jgi:lipoprotein-releasing system ATP-binding protein|nr:MAG: Lipoprotein-releasing system ATP-binding protein LolD [Bacteroidia bacterium]
MIIGKDLSKKYGSLTVLKSVNVSIKKGEILGITGPSGAGKSTLLQILGTLDFAENGSLEFDGKDLLSLSPKKIAKFRNENIGFIFQFHHLLPEFTALENVCMPALISGLEKKDAEEKALKLLKTLGLEHRTNHKPNELSGGEQQRVSVARALINNPSVIFADEPSGNLDTENARDLHQLFHSLRDEYGQTFVIVTHNHELANMADRVIEMRDGQIVN